MQTDLGMIESLAAKGSKSSDYLRKQTELRREEDSLVQLSARVREAAIKEAELTVFARRKEAEANSVSRRRDELEQLKCQLRGFQIAEDNLRDQYASLQKEMEKASGDSMELLFKKDELNQSQKVLDRIAERLSQLQTEQGAPARVIWHQEAIPPQAPVQDFPYRNASLALLIGLGLPFGLAVAWERYVRRIGDADCLQREASLAVLGETARLPTRALGRPSTGAAVRGSFTLFEESVDSLRTGLTLSSDMRDVRVLAVTSAVQNEGKTSVAAQLAISLARATGELVLLLDGDLRSPDLHRLFEVPLEPGLADVLANRCSIEKAIVVDVGDRQVHLLPAGRPRTSPHRLLGNGSWSSLVQSIPSIYRYVIVDTPPVLAASESLVLARGADASLVCAMRDVSRADQVQKATERLVAAGSHVVGAVLNGVPTPIYARRYGEYPFASE
jgi:capsular exopolysaccharide synthesis family protein